MNGWIKLHRKLLDWEWYHDANTARVFLHCLLKANFEQKKWQGMTIDRGEFFTSIGNLARELNLSTKAIRTSLKKLENTENVASRGASNGTMITILKFDTYQVFDDNEGQAEGQTKGKRRANEGQAKGNNVRSKELNNEKNYKISLLSQIAKDDLDVKNQEYFEIALAFWSLFKQINQEVGAPTTTLDKAKGTWIDDIRLLIETDGATKEQLREIWNWLPHDDFWKKNIASTKTLRKQFEKLIKQMNYGKNGQNPNETKQRLEAVGNVLSGIFEEWDKEG